MGSSSVASVGQMGSSGVGSINQMGRLRCVVHEAHANCEMQVIVPYASLVCDGFAADVFSEVMKSKKCSEENFSNWTSELAAIKNEVKQGRGVFVICPKIEQKDSEASRRPTSGNFVPQNYSFGFTANQEIKSVKQEYEKLSKEIFPDLRITMLYGKMKAEEKERIMQDFKKGEIDILLSTSVVEVGVDVPRATIMMIEGAERFGLSQLHQFRGRVGRSDMQSYCFLFTTEESQQNRKRLKAMERSSNGFELAEEDLKIRGPGQLYGTQQWGLPDTAMQNLSNIFLIEKTRSEAKELLEKDPTLQNYPLLKARLKHFEQKIHFE